MSRNRAADTGVSLSTVLVIVFLVLKLTDNITWSWIWVFSPWWISVALVVVLVFLIVLARGFVGVLEKRGENRRLKRQHQELLRRQGK